MQTRQGTVTVIAESREAALAWLHAGYTMVDCDCHGTTWKGSVGYVVDVADDGVTMTFRLWTGVV